MADVIFLHLGAHKTATTYMQNLFRYNEGSFHEYDTELVFKKALSENGLNAFFSWRRKIESDPDSKGPSKLRRFLSKLTSSDNKYIFISYEGFLGRMDVSSSHTIYPAALCSVDFLKKSFVGKEVKVIFCLRNYADFVESSYNWLVKNGSGKKFHEYVDGVHLDELSWKPVVNALRSGFGDDNVLFWKYEDYKQNHKAINARLLEFLYEGKAVELEYRDNSAKNISLGGRSVKAMAAFNRVANQISFIPQRNKKKYAKAVGKLLESVQKTGMGFSKYELIPAETRKHLDDRYKQHIDELITDGVRFIHLPEVKQ